MLLSIFTDIGMLVLLNHCTWYCGMMRVWCCSRKPERFNWSSCPQEHVQQHPTSSSHGIRRFAVNCEDMCCARCHLFHHTCFHNGGNSTSLCWPRLSFHFPKHYNKLFTSINGTRKSDLQLKACWSSCWILQKLTQEVRRRITKKLKCANSSPGFAGSCQLEIYHAAGTGHFRW